MKLLISIFLILIVPNNIYSIEREKETQGTIPTERYVNLIETRAAEVFCHTPRLPENLQNKNGRSCVEIMTPIFKECVSDVETVYGNDLSRKELDELSKIMFFCAIEPLIKTNNKNNPKISATALEKLQPYLSNFVHIFLAVRPK